MIASLVRSRRSLAPGTPQGEDDSINARRRLFIGTAELPPCRFSDTIPKGGTAKRFAHFLLASGRAGSYSKDAKGLFACTILQA